MPMYNNDWEAALKTMQPNMGGVQNARQPGQMGNVSYAPNMMRGFQPPQLPLARDLAPTKQAYGVNPGMGQPPSGGYQTYTGGTVPGGGAPGPAFTPAQTSGFLDALRRLIAARGSVAATRGGRGGYPGLGGLMRPY